MELFSYPFVQLAVLCVLVIAGIHAYLGYHVVSRGVIFVDLSLAQVAALGAVVAFCVGVPDGPLRFLVSLAFTFVGALVISVSHTRDNRVPHEAFIGIVYAGSSALSVLLLSHHPEGSELLEHMIAGSLLTVAPAELIRLAALYAVVGAFFFVYKDRFALISADRSAARARGWNLVWWDFFFYAAFALVVTFSVHLAGVLLVFSLLVVPPVTALLVTPKPTLRLVIGWVVGGFAAVAGIMASVTMDLPTGPSVITALVATLLLVALGVGLGRRARQQLRARN